MESIVEQINKKAAKNPPHNNIFYSNQIPTESDIKSFGSNLLPVIFPFNISENIDIVKGKILSRMKDKIVEIRTGDYAIPKVYGSNARLTALVKFDDWFYEINNFKANSAIPPPYLGNYKLHKDDINTFGLNYPIFSEAIFSLPSLWIGGTGCITPLHQDGPDNFVYQIAGSKKWILIHPFYSNFLQIKQPFPNTTPNFFVSEIDLRENSINKYNPIEIVLEQGQALYLPSGWFHYVETIRLSMTINFWIDAKVQLPIYL